MRTYASSRVKRKSFYRRSELQMFLLISGGHIGAPKMYTSMASQYKALPRYQPRPHGFSLKKWVGPTHFLRENPGDEVAKVHETFRQITHKLWATNT